MSTHHSATAPVHHITRDPQPPSRGVVPATGARRRLRALAALGHDLRDVCAATPNLILDDVEPVRAGRRKDIHLSVELAVREVYEHLSGRVGPDAATRERARFAHWAPPLAWDEETIDDGAARPVGVRPLRAVTPCRYVEEDPLIDDVAVQRAIDGDEKVAATLTASERIVAVRAGARRGWSDATIAGALGIQTRSVFRIRADYGIAPGVEPNYDVTRAA